MKEFKPKTEAELTDAEKELLKSLLNYPSLEKVFDPSQPQNFSGMKKRLQSSLVELERVIRGGTKDDAEKAVEIAEAYKTTLNFLDELERQRKNKSR